MGLSDAMPRAEEGGGKIKKKILGKPWKNMIVKTERRHIILIYSEA